MTDIVENAVNFEVTTGYLSLSVWFFHGGKELSELCKDSDCAKWIVLPFYEAGAIFGAVIGVIETVFWGTIAVLAKAVHVFVPKSWETANSIYTSLVGRALQPIQWTIFCVAQAVSPCFEIEEESLREFLESVKESCKPFFNYQPFGGTAPA